MHFRVAVIYKESWDFIAHLIKEKAKNNHLACTLLCSSLYKDQISDTI